MNSRDRSTRSAWVWRLAVMATVALGGLAVAAGAPAGQVDVTDRMPQRVAVSALPGPKLEITKHKYSRPTLTVPVGTTVTWVNRDDDVHTVVSTTLAFRSAGLETDDVYSYEFTKPGVYEYFCTLHPLMTGKVIVK